MRTRWEIFFLCSVALLVTVIITWSAVISAKNTRALVKKADTALDLSSQQFDEAVRMMKITDEESVRGLLSAYLDNLAVAGSEADRITSDNEAAAAYETIFKTTTAQMQRLKDIRTHPLFLNTPGVIDKVMDANMKAQEHAALRIASLKKSAERPFFNTAKSNTDGRLSCPDCNVILISLTALRNDHMGIYGYEKPTTPNIDRYFKDALIFNETTAPTTWTAPNAVSLFTSLFPYRHGIMMRTSFPVHNREILTLPRILRNNGYRTAAFTGGGDYNNRFIGIASEFDLYLDEENYAKYGIKKEIPVGLSYLKFEPVNTYLPLSMDWLEKNSQEKFFLMIQGYDMHCPLTPRQPFAEQFTKELYSAMDFSYCHWTHADTPALSEDGKKYWIVQVPSKDPRLPPTETKFFQHDVDFMNGLYDARVAETDHYLNGLFQKITDLGLEKDTIIILMSDHGEMLGEHGRFMRGGSLRGSFYEPALRFPLLVKHPNVHEPVFINDLAQTVDLMPSILSMLELPDPQENIREGAKLQFSNFRDKPTNLYSFAASRYSPISSGRYFGSSSASEVIRDKTWKLLTETLFDETRLEVATMTYKLFNLENDPEEETDLYMSKPREADLLKRELEKWLAGYR